MNICSLPDDCHLLILNFIPIPTLRCLVSPRWKLLIEQHILILVKRFHLRLPSNIHGHITYELYDANGAKHSLTTTLNANQVNLFTRLFPQVERFKFIFSPWVYPNDGGLRNYMKHWGKHLIRLKLSLIHNNEIFLTTFWDALNQLTQLKRLSLSIGSYYISDLSQTPAQGLNPISVPQLMPVLARLECLIIENAKLSTMDSILRHLSPQTLKRLELKPYVANWYSILDSFGRNSDNFVNLTHLSLKEFSNQFKTNKDFTPLYEHIGRNCTQLVRLEVFFPNPDIQLHDGFFKHIVGLENLHHLTLENVHEKQIRGFQIPIISAIQRSIRRLDITIIESGYSNIFEGSLLGHYWYPNLRPVKTHIDSLLYIQFNGSFSRILLELEWLCVTVLSLNLLSTCQTVGKCDLEREFKHKARTWFTHLQDIECRVFNPKHAFQVSGDGYVSPNIHRRPFDHLPPRHNFPPGQGPNVFRGQGYNIPRGPGANIHRAPGQNVFRGQGYNIPRGPGPNIHRGTGPNIPRAPGPNIHRARGPNIPRGPSVPRAP